MSEYERPDRLRREPTVEDVRQLMGASTPHFALQLRNRIRTLIAGLPAGYEATARAVASGSIAAMLYLLLVRIRAVPDLSGRSDIHERTGILLTATSLGFGVGMLYEVAAWASNSLFHAQAFTFDDLIAHMAIDFVASAAGATLLVLWDRAGWQTRRVPASVLLKPTR